MIGLIGLIGLTAICCLSRRNHLFLGKQPRWMPASCRDAPFHETIDWRWYIPTECGQLPSKITTKRECLRHLANQTRWFDKSDRTHRMNRMDGRVDLIDWIDGNLLFVP
ncbi:MAG: hypothetical protein H6544_07160 [Prevotellaceae bacterium]|nr:hypothetical protein [Prevotellaceae bacterium]